MRLHPGMEIQLSCSSVGVPPPMIVWYREDSMLVNGSGGALIANSGNESNLMITDNRGQQGGEYNCTGFSIAGQNSVTFTVQCKVKNVISLN